MKNLLLTDTVLIWSIEHNAWWRANSHGYTRDLADAGVYLYSEALQILQGANIAMHHGHRMHGPNEAIVPITDVVDKGIRGARIMQEVAYDKNSE